MVNKLIRRLYLALMLLILGTHSLSAQTFDFERQNVGRYVQRMYENTHAEGVQIIDTGNNQYIVAVLSLNETAFPNTLAMNRVAQVKANSMISKYLNGSRVFSVSVVNLEYDADSLVVRGMATETIRDISIGHVKSVGLFLSFKLEDRIIYIYGAETDTK